MGPFKSLGYLAVAIAIAFSTFAAVRELLHWSSLLSGLTSALTFIVSAIIPGIIDWSKKILDLRKTRLDIRKIRLDIQKAELELQLNKTRLEARKIELEVKAQEEEQGLVQRAHWGEMDEEAERARKRMTARRPIIVKDISQLKDKFIKAEDTVFDATIEEKGEGDSKVKKTGA